MLEDIKKSILSGICIAVGGSVYLSSIAMGYKWFGAVLFAAGLFTICMYGFNLYTGKVGYIAYKFKDFKYIRLVILIVVFNLISTYLLGILVAYTYPKIGEVAVSIYMPKLENSLLKTFISATFCGLLMFLAVDTWKKGTKIGCFLFVPTFIIAGFDHSIANSFYNGAALGFNAFTVQNALLVTVTVLGNALGGMLVPLMTRTWKEQ